MDQLSALLTPGTSSTPSCRGRKDQDYFELMNKPEVSSQMTSSFLFHNSIF